MKRVAMTDFGKDHWSLLGYIETLCVDSINKGVGTIDKRRVRSNEKTHPIHAVNHNIGGMPGWDLNHGTRLRGFWKPDESTDPQRQLGKHDDWDCLDDLEAEGLVEVISLANGFVKLTDKGREIALRLRAHKSKGGYFSNFTLETTVAS